MADPLRIVGTQLNASMFFVLFFNRMPDFDTLDNSGRQADSFQIFIAFDPNTPSPANPQMADVLIRGEEIHLSHDIRVRDARPLVKDPVAGGWGALRGSVPYMTTLLPGNGAVLTFTVPFSLLGVSGKFCYELETYSYGSQVDSARGVAP